MRNTCLFFQPGNLQNTQCINVDGWSALDGMYKMVCSKWAKRPNLVARFQPEMQQMTSPILTPHSDLLSKFQQRLIPITIAFCKGSWLTPPKYGWTIRLNMRGKWVSQASYFRGEFRYGGIQRQTVLGIPVKIKDKILRILRKKTVKGWSIIHS